MRAPEVSARKNPPHWDGGFFEHERRSPPLPGKEAERRLTWVGRAAIKRHNQRLPKFGVRVFRVVMSRREFLVQWTRPSGWRVLAVRLRTGGWPLPEWTPLYQGDPMMFRKRVQDPASVKLPDLPNVSKTFAKFPTFVAFFTSRTYEDGSPRAVGKYWFDASGSGFSITLIDVDQGFRLVVRGPTIDDAFAAAEVALGSDSAPWEVDQYQQDRIAKKSKKK
jgi:hypothetical protein